MDVEVSLIHWPGGTATSGPALLAKTTDPETLRLVRDRLIAEAQARAGVSSEIEPELAEIHASDAARLERKLRLLIPDHSENPALRLVHGRDEDANRT